MWEDEKINKLCYSFGTLGVGLRKYCSQKLHYSFGTQALSWSVPWASLLAKCGATTEDGSCWLLLHQNVLMLFATFLDRCASDERRKEYGSVSVWEKTESTQKSFKTPPGSKFTAKHLIVWRIHQTPERHNKCQMYFKFICMLFVQQMRALENNWRYLLKVSPNLTKEA